MTHALKKTSILNDKKAIHALFTEGRWKNCPLFHMVYHPAGETCFLFTTRRQIKGVVRRNRAKRVMREAVRLHQDEIPRGYHYGFIANIVPEKGRLPEYERQLQNMMRKIQ